MWVSHGCQGRFALYTDGALCPAAPWRTNDNPGPQQWCERVECRSPYVAAYNKGPETVCQLQVFGGREWPHASMAPN